MSGLFTKGTIAFAVVLTLFGASLVFSQSKRQNPETTDTKRNRRVAEPAPSPTPISTSAATSDNSEADEEDDVISVDTRLVTIPVRVIDRKGRFVGGLDKKDFRVLEDNVEQEIAHFSNEQQPFTVALVLDMSYSAKFKLADIQSAAISFIDLLRPEDRVMVIAFAEETLVMCQPTSDRKEIYRAIRSTKIDTGTSLYEAVDLTMNELLRPIEGRKAMVLFTDGVDTTSRRAFNTDNLSDAMELDALIYPIRYDTYDDVRQMSSRPVVIGDNKPKGTPPISPTGNTLPFPIPIVATPSDRGTTKEEYERGEEYLDKLAQHTGGTKFVADTVINLNQAFARIASELREFYSLSYYPDDTKQGKTRKIKVRVDQKDVAVKTRESYTISDPGQSARAKVSK
ncbi:MAG: VWA domain-containing protein [Acidobacteria bacterium]|nr:VWA domain-containing protein [Acidobacteriota bacterium]